MEKMINKNFISELSKTSVFALSLFFGIISPLVASFILNIRNVESSYFMLYVVINVLFYYFSGLLIKSFVVTKFQKNCNPKKSVLELVRTILIGVTIFFVLGFVLPFVKVSFLYFIVADSIILLYPIWFVYVFLIIILGVEENRKNLKKDLIKIDKKLNKIINKLK